MDEPETISRVMQILLAVYTVEGAALWLNGPSPMLGGRRPIDVIVAGDGERVVKLAMSIIDCDEL